MHNLLQLTVLSWACSAAFILPPNRNLNENQSGSNVDEYGHHFKGNIRISKKHSADTVSRDLISTKYRWPNKTVPYQLSMEHTKEQRDYIEKSLKIIESISCVRFIRRTNETDYIEITAKDSGCYSEVGFQHGKQMLNLQKSQIGDGCFIQTSIMHEFLHALGFYHMHQVYNRDEFIDIHWENVEVGKEIQFRKYTNPELTLSNSTYDYFSIMHYGAYYFSKNGRPTIVPKDNKYFDVIGQHEHLSDKDVRKLNVMYDCSDCSGQTHSQ